MQRRYPQVIAEVRGRGFLLGVQFAGDRLRWPESLLGVALEQQFFAPLFVSYMLNVEGVRVAPTLIGKSVVRIEPALTMTWPQCERLLSALERRSHYSRPATQVVSSRRSSKANLSRWCGRLHRRSRGSTSNPALASVALHF